MIGYFMKIRSLLNNTCYGRFHIALEVLGMFPLVIMNDLFGKCIILKAEHNFILNRIEYSAWSDALFEPVLEGQVIPYYRVVIEHDELKVEKVEELNEQKL